jgi:hypothetical protein
MNGRIDLTDFAMIAAEWLSHEVLPCGAGNNWCSGADLNFDRQVNIDDLLSFTSCWLTEDAESPSPNPSEWAIEPNAVPGSFTSIMMTAVETHDGWRSDEHISYYFECLNDPTKSSGWIAEPTYAIQSLTPGFEYTFTVRARDVRFNETDPTAVINETAPSVERGVKPGAKAVLTPNPALFVEGTPYVSAANTVRMEAVAYNGPTLPAGIWVEYWFEYIGSQAGGNSSAWQTSRVYLDSGLTVGLTYEYRVWMRFNTSYGAFEPAILRLLQRLRSRKSMSLRPIRILRRSKMGGRSRARYPPEPIGM